ncbi:MAG: A24 family peptidase [Candidatus Undinarchaeales archaeon]|jgi:hypothetical protein|nr:A24 family peptidase [Candidatus Undinarchaeales archaeon]
MIGTLILIIALAATLYGSYTDWKIREVPNWVSYSLVIVMLALRLIDFALTRNLTNLLYALGTGGAFLVLGLVMFYTSQWGGADMKILTAMGIGFGNLLGPIFPTYFAPWPFGITFLTNLLIVAAIYSVLYGFVISYENKKVFKDMRKSMKNHEMKIILIVFAISCVGILFDRVFSMIALLPPLWLLMRYMKSVEKNCLVRERTWKDVVEFDVPVKEVKSGGRVLQDTEDPNGFTLETLAKCRTLAKKGKLPKKIIVKWGIPMIPVFPIAILLSIYFGDLLFLLMNYVA